MTDAPIEILLSAASLTVTAYFWFVQARRERPQLRLYQVGGFRAVCRRHQQRDDCKRLCVQQLDSCGVLVANNSIRQNSIVMFDCWLLLPDGRELRGDWGSVGDQQPPWNIGPESSISLGLACFFDVPADFEIPETYQLGIAFVTASGKRFKHVFTSTVASSTDTGRLRQAA